MGLLESFRGTPPEEAVAAQVTSLRERRDAEAKKATWLEAQIRDEEHDAALGNYDAARKHAGALKGQLEETRHRVAELEGTLRDAEGRMAAAIAARLAREAAEQELRIPELAAKHMKVAEEVTELAQQLGDALKLLVGTGAGLAAATGTAECQRVFGLAAIAERVRHCMFNEFQFRQPRISSFGPRAREAFGEPFDFFPYPINPASPLLKTRLDVLERSLLDGSVRVYRSKQEALRAKERIGPRREDLHAKRMESGAWRLVDGRLRGHLAKVDAALRDAEPEEAAS